MSDNERYMYNKQFNKFIKTLDSLASKCGAKYLRRLLYKYN